MNNSNSFNVCSRCGSANSLSAKYCYQCGSQLKVPDEPIVCPKCHSINSSLANFCRACGNTLRTNAKTKVCPRCKKQISIDQAQCSCGYSFATVRPISNDGAVKQKGGRLVALLSIIFVALFALALLTPFEFVQNLLFKANMYFLSDDTGVASNGIQVVQLVLATVTSIFAEKSLVFDALIVVLAMFSLAVISMGIHSLCALLRLIHGKRSKRANVFYLIMALLTGAVTTLLVVANMQLPNEGFLAFFVMPQGYALGWGILIIPAYYLFFFVFSLFAKSKKTKRKI